MALGLIPSLYGDMPFAGMLVAHELEFQLVTVNPYCHAFTPF